MFKMFVSGVTICIKMTSPLIMSLMTDAVLDTAAATQNQSTIIQPLISREVCGYAIWQTFLTFAITCCLTTVKLSLFL